MAACRGVWRLVSGRPWCIGSFLLRVTTRIRDLLISIVEEGTRKLFRLRKKIWPNMPENKGIAFFSQVNFPSSGTGDTCGSDRRKKQPKKDSLFFSLHSAARMAIIHPDNFVARCSMQLNTNLRGMVREHPAPRMRGAQDSPNS